MAITNAPKTVWKGALAPVDWYDSQPFARADPTNAILLRLGVEKIMLSQREHLDI
jgi:hypothetical protein